MYPSCPSDYDKQKKSSSSYAKSNNVQWKTLVRENISKFSNLMAIRQSFLSQVNRIFNIYILLVGNSPKFSLPNNLYS